MTVKWIAGTTDLYDRSQEQKQMRRAKDHLYRELENSAAWPIIDEAIEKLVRNKDLIEQTDRRYVVGFVLKALSDNGLLKKQARD